MRLAKEALLKAEDTDLASGLRFERHAFTLLAGTADRAEGLAAFREKRTPNSPAADPAAHHSTP